MSSRCDLAHGPRAFRNVSGISSGPATPLVFIFAIAEFNSIHVKSLPASLSAQGLLKHGLVFSVMSSLFLSNQAAAQLRDCGELKGSATAKNSLRILQWNADGIKPKLHELEMRMRKQTDLPLCQAMLLFDMTDQEIL